MEDVTVQPGLSEGARIIDTFVAPGKTFTDILRNASWWGPLLVLLVVGLIFSAAVDKKVGFSAVAQQQISKNKMQSDRMESLPPEKRAAVYAAAAKQFKYTTYGFGVFVLIFAAIISLLWWASLNFGLGATTKFSQIFAIAIYTSLPKALMSLLAAILLFAGVGTDNFDLQNPIGTNIGYYLPDTSPVLKVAGSFFDVFGLWSLVLAVIGTAIVARKKPSQTAIVVVGWWVLGLLISVGFTAAFS